MHWNKVLRIACFSCTLVLAGALRAQSVQYFGKEKLWLLSTDHNSYVLAVGPHGELRHLYWGLPVQREGDLTPLGPVPDISSFDPSQLLINEEYPGWGGRSTRSQPLRSRARMATATWCCVMFLTAFSKTIWKSN